MTIRIVFKQLNCVEINLFNVDIELEFLVDEAKHLVIQLIDKLHGLKPINNDYPDLKHAIKTLFDRHNIMFRFTEKVADTHVIVNQGKIVDGINPNHPLNDYKSYNDIEKISKTL